MDLATPTLVAGSGFAIGLAFGAVVERTGFCTAGAISDAVALGDLGRLRSWLLAIAVAIGGTQALHLAGAIDLRRSIYTGASLGWLGALGGGALFGFGMTLAGGCGSRTLARLGAGNLKSLVVVLVLGVVAYMTLRGLLAAARIGVIERTNLDLARFGARGQGLPDLATALGLPAAGARVGLAGALVAGLLWFCLRDAAFRADRRRLGAGLAVGALCVAGWAATGILGRDAFEPTPLASLTFVAPVGDALVYLMLASGSTLGFGAAAVFGVVAGAFVSARASGTFRLEGFADRADLLRHLGGGALMGVGGVLALGCTIGQGLSGLSTLALGSFLAVAGIAAGGVAGTLALEEGALGPALRRIVGRA